MINRWAKAAARAAAILGVLTLTGCGLALAADTLSLDQPTSGRLEAGDETLESGEYADAYAFEGQAGARYVIVLTSDDFDAYLAVTGDGLADENDDEAGRGNSNSRLEFVMPADGEVTVVATSYAPGESGAYTLRISAADGSAATAPTPTGLPGEGHDFAQAFSTNGALASGDETLDGGEYIDTFAFSGRRGQRVAITLESGEFDAWLMLRGPAGAREVDNDDADDETTNSRIDTVLDTDGDYVLSVTSFGARETGSYRLTVTPSEGSPHGTTVPGGPRVFAVMVGITDYGGAQSNLDYTAEDAIKMADALRRQQVLNPASVTLTNAQATVAGVRDAIRRTAALAGPDDVFLFFYSGHGGQNRSSVSSTEPDGKAETLVLRDGEITDTELAALLATVRARMTILAIDSCFSGGFARNTVSRPGVMGIFSSEEDLTSAVADEFQAGGYLSHFLREGLAGAGDLDGDRVITAGELSTYLRRRFARDAVDIAAETDDGQQNYQTLVVDRGSVRINDVVIRLGQ